MKTSRILMSVMALQLACGVGHAASIKKDLEAETVIQKALAPEAITIADQGDRLAFIAKSLNEFSSAPPTTAWLTKKENGKWTEPQALPWRGMVTSVSFANHDQWLVATTSRGTLNGYLKILKNLLGDREQIGNLEGFDHRIEIFDARNPAKLVQSFSPQDMGLSQPEMLKHARISPDGKWLAFYTHGYQSQRGVHLHNMQTGKNIYLGAYDDKHPTWTPDGSKILFHSQSGGDSFTNTGGPEQSVIGYYEMKSLGDQVSFNRVMMESHPEGYVYQKHPSVYPGTDLMFFHAENEEGDSKKLYVRRLKPDSKIYKLKDLMADGVELKGLKHANSSFGGSGIFFVGHKKDAATTEMRTREISPETTQTVQVQDVKDIYWISDAEVQEINRQVKD